MNKTTAHPCWKRLVSLLLCLVVVCSLSAAVTQPAEAKDNRAKIISLAFGKRVKGDSFQWNMNTSVWTYPLYKITVPKDGYITVTNHLAGKLQYNYFYLYKSQKDFLADKNDYGCRTVVKCREVKKTIVCPVKKGTYYIHSEGWGDSVIYGKRYDFEVKFTPKAADKNLTRAKAAALKSGAKATAYVSDSSKTVRWYKISVSKAKALRLSVVNPNEYQVPGTVTLTNAKGKAVKVTKSEDGTFVTPKLSKGTYYVKLKASGTGTYQLSWR